MLDIVKSQIFIYGLNQEWVNGPLNIDYQFLWYLYKPLIYRTLMQGDKSGGFTVFWADDGLDTGPILLQKKCFVAPDDTVDSIYNRFLFPEGVKAMVCKIALFLERRQQIPIT